MRSSDHGLRSISRLSRRGTGVVTSLRDRSRSIFGITGSGNALFGQRFSGRSRRFFRIWGKGDTLHPRNLGRLISSNDRLYPLGNLTKKARLHFLADDRPDMLEQRGQKSTDEESTVLLYSGAIEIASTQHAVDNVFSAALIRKNAFLQRSHKCLSGSKRLLPYLLGTLGFQGRRVGTPPSRGLGLEIRGKLRNASHRSGMDSRRCDR